jgi:hypothetical protein
MLFVFGLRKNQIHNVEFTFVIDYGYYDLIKYKYHTIFILMCCLITRFAKLYCINKYFLISLTYFWCLILMLPPFEVEYCIIEIINEFCYYLFNC